MRRNEYLVMIVQHIVMSGEVARDAIGRKAIR